MVASRKNMEIVLGDYLLKKRSLTTIAYEKNIEKKNCPDYFTLRSGLNRIFSSEKDFFKLDFFFFQIYKKILLNTKKYFFLNLGFL